MRASFTAWDARTGRRALGVAILMVGLAWLVTAATDEGNVRWGERLGRALPVTPICAAIGAWIAVAPGRVRGELRALAALGRSPWQNARAAALGGAMVAAAAGLAIAGSSRVDVAGFYPEIGGGAQVTFEGRAFVDKSSGFRIDRDGDLTPADVAPSPREARVPANGRAAAGIATFLAGLALALIAASPGRRAAWLAGAGVAGALTVVLFQAAAARRVPSVWAILPPALLLAAALSRYREVRWRTR